jgi:hypothetical protein
MEEEYMEIEMPEGKEKKKWTLGTGGSFQKTRFKGFLDAERKAAAYIRKEAPVVRKYIKKGAVTAGEYMAEGLEFLEKEKLEKLEEIQKTRPLTEYEAREMERVRGMIQKFENVAMKQKERLEKLNEVV